jgi:FMN reductase
MTRRALAVVTAGLSQPSATRLLADQLAAATRRSLEARRAELQVDVIELRDHAHDVVNNMLSGFPSKELAGVIDTVGRADGLVVVTPIFNATFSGLLKVFCDVLEPDSLAGKPVLIAATGGSQRHSLALEHALRPLFVYLRAVVVPTAVYAASEDWGSGDGAGGGSGAGAGALGAGGAGALGAVSAALGSRVPPLAARVDRAAEELAALVYSGAPAPVPDPYEDPVPFESLLSAQKPPL